jgi:hypothetical protein
MYISIFISIYTHIYVGVKSERRQKKDEKKRKHAAFKNKLQHEEDKFVAVNMQVEIFNY